MADSQQPFDEQVTSQTPATKQKNPKRVAAGKLVAQRTKQAREAQKKALIEAQNIVAKNDLKQTDPPPVSEPVAEPPQVESTKNVLTTTQWLSVIGIIVSLAGVYYKREEIKSVLAQKTPVEMPPVQPPSMPRAPHHHRLITSRRLQEEKRESERWIRLSSVLIYG